MVMRNEGNGDDDEIGKRQNSNRMAQTDGCSGIGKN